MTFINRTLAAVSPDQAMQELTSQNTQFASPKGGMAEVLGSIITIMLELAGALAVVYLVYSGILYLTAAGNPDNAKKGAQGVTNAIIGIIVIVLAFAIVTAVRNTVLKIG